MDSILNLRRLSFVRKRLRQARQIRSEKCREFAQPDGQNQLRLGRRLCYQIVIRTGMFPSKYSIVKYSLAPAKH